MFIWATTFFVIAIIAAVLGFTSIMGPGINVAKISFIIFLVLADLFLIFGRDVYKRQSFWLVSSSVLDLIKMCIRDRSVVE